MDLKNILHNHEATRTWLTYLEQMDDPRVLITLPSADELPQVLLGLAVPHEDIDPLIALLPTFERAADARWVLERAAQTLVQHMGQVEGPPWFPPMPDELGVFGRYFFVFVYVAVLPYTRAYHQERGIPDDIARATLADLGRQMAVYRQRHGTGGLNAPFWPMNHFTGKLYALGRLQFERARLGNSSGQGVAQAGLPYGPGDHILSVHIPAFFGPLSPTACDASFARAKPFFAQHFPEQPYEIAMCWSWLLDEQLADYLPADSNIVRFGRRFTPAYTPKPNNQDTLSFVFNTTETNLDALPQRTRLERIVVEHIRAGRSWHGGVGWTHLP
jgi:hypothetical protein